MPTVFRFFTPANITFIISPVCTHSKGLKRKKKLVQEKSLVAFRSLFPLLFLAVFSFVLFCFFFFSSLFCALCFNNFGLFFHQVWPCISLPLSVSSSLTLNVLICTFYHSSSSRKFPVGFAAALLTAVSSTSLGTGGLAWNLPLASVFHVVFCFHRVEPFLSNWEIAKASRHPSLSCCSARSLHLLLPSPLLFYWSHTGISEVPMVYPRGPLPWTPSCMEEEKLSLLPFLVLDSSITFSVRQLQLLSNLVLTRFPWAPPPPMLILSAFFLWKSHLSASNILLLIY